ncbi:hypothetical protein AB9F45_37555, partial [Rhizobium leguminosarum]
VIIFTAISILLVALPLALDYSRNWFPLFADTLDIVFSWRIYGTLVVLKRSSGRIDALLNNGAYGQPGAVEDLSTATLRAKFEA